MKVDRNSAIAIGGLLAVAIAIGISSSRPAPGSDFRVIAGELKKGMSLGEVISIVRGNNIDFSVAEEGGKTHMLIGGETWRNLFTKENQLVLGFDEKKILRSSYIDVLYQFDEVAGNHDFPIE